MSSGSCWWTWTLHGPCIYCRFYWPSVLHIVSKKCGILSQISTIVFHPWNIQVLPVLYYYNEHEWMKMSVASSQLRIIFSSMLLTDLFFFFFWCSHDKIIVISVFTCIYVFMFVTWHKSSILASCTEHYLIDAPCNLFCLSLEKRLYKCYFRCC